MPLEPRFKLTAHRWYGWQMLPGYGEGAPYFSPIFVQSSALVPSDPNLRNLEFLNLKYAAGAQHFVTTLRPVLWSQTFVLAQLVDPEPDDHIRAAVISRITFDWLQIFCPELLGHHSHRAQADDPNHSVEAYLTAAFGFA